MGIKKKKTQTRTKPGGTSVRPMLNVRKDTTSDRYTLVIRILRARRRGVVFTPFKLLPEEFDPVKGRAVPNLNIREHRRSVPCATSCTRSTVSSRSWSSSASWTSRPLWSSGISWCARG